MAHVNRNRVGDIVPDVRRSVLENAPIISSGEWLFHHRDTSPISGDYDVFTRDTLVWLGGQTAAVLRETDCRFIRIGHLDVDFEDDPVQWNRYDGRMVPDDCAKCIGTAAI